MTIDSAGDNAGRPARPRSGWLWRAAAVCVVLLGAGLIYFRHNAVEARLLRSDPDIVAFEPTLARFAIGLGRSVFETHCARCHGASGAGDPASGVPNLTDADWLYGAGRVSEIERIVSYGIRSHNPKAWNLAIMPAFARATPSPAGPKIPRLAPTGLDDIVEFLVAASGRPADAAAAKRGAALYNDEGGCYDCHSADATGDSAIGAPNLVDRVWLYGDGSRQSIRESIANGRQGVCPAWIGTISPGQIREVAVYVHSLSDDARQPGS